MTGLLLGNVSARTGKHIGRDAQNVKVADLPETNQHIDPPYCNGWAM